jgi:hypothetical protein
VLAGHRASVLSRRNPSRPLAGPPAPWLGLLPPWLGILSPGWASCPFRAGSACPFRQDLSRRHRVADHDHVNSAANELRDSHDHEKSFRSCRVLPGAARPSRRTVPAVTTRHRSQRHRLTRGEVRRSITGEAPVTPGGTGRAPAPLASARIAESPGGTTRVAAAGPNPPRPPAPAARPGCPPPAGPPRSADSPSGDPPAGQLSAAASRCHDGVAMSLDDP